MKETWVFVFFRSRRNWVYYIKWILSRVTCIWNQVLSKWLQSYKWLKLEIITASCCFLSSICRIVLHMFSYSQSTKTQTVTTAADKINKVNKSSMSSCKNPVINPARLSLAHSPYIQINLRGDVPPLQKQWNCELGCSSSVGHQLFIILELALLVLNASLVHSSGCNICKVNNWINESTLKKRYNHEAIDKMPSKVLLINLS